MESTESDTVAMPYDPALLEAMACDIDARPLRAPHFHDVANAVRNVQRVPGALIVDYDPAALATLESLVAAERRCCADIGWHLERLTPEASDGADAVVRLRIEATTAQLDVVGHLFQPAPLTK